MATEEIDFVKEYEWLRKEAVELSKKVPNNDQIKRQAMKAQASSVMALALRRA